MAILSKDQARDIMQKVVNFSGADFCEVNLQGNRNGNIRYARNTVTTSGEDQDTSLTVQSSFGKKTGTATVNEFDEESLRDVVRRSEELAKLAPDDPEYMEPLGPQEYGESKTYFGTTADLKPDERAQYAYESITPSDENDLVSAGFLQDRVGFTALLNSKGLFAYNQSTDVSFSVTSRTKDGTGSGWASQDFNDVTNLDTRSATETAIQKSLGSQNAVALEPGNYTVILEPHASAGLMNFMFNAMNARTADEGRSFMSKSGGGTRVGEQMFDERVTIYSDPFNIDAPRAPFTGEGLPRKKTMWIENGVVKNLSYSRYWAEKNNREPLPGPANRIMEGGTKSTEDLIAETERGILVTRTWYIRMVDPQSLLLTGLTRDGTFYIENGQISHAVRNFRFNESPVIMLNNLEELGKPVRTNGHMVPPMKVRDFTFSSLSDAV